MGHEGVEDKKEWIQMQKRIMGYYRVAAMGFRR